MDEIENGMIRLDEHEAQLRSLIFKYCTAEGIPKFIAAKLITKIGSRLELTAAAEDWIALMSQGARRHETNTRSRNRTGKPGI